MSDTEPRAARRGLLVEMSKLPYSASVTYPLPSPSSGWVITAAEESFLEQVLCWLAAYSVRVNSITGIAADMRQELNTYRSQREAIRAYLGTNREDHP